MSSLRSPARARINLLFFQDIITLVIGILILITLMLSLSLGGAAATVEEQQLENELREVRASIARVEIENQRAQEQSLAAAALPGAELLENQIAALRRETNAAFAELQRSQFAAVESQQRAAAASARKKVAEQAQANLAEMEKAISELREKLAAARTNNTLQIIPAASSESARSPIAFVVSADKLQLRRFDGPNNAEVSLASGVDSARELFARLDARRESIVFYFRPSGAKWFYPLRTLARAGGFEVGYDAVEEQQQLVFRRP
jgi:hypothetical protein